MVVGQWRMLYNEDSSRTFKYQLKIWIRRLRTMLGTSYQSGFATRQSHSERPRRQPRIGVPVLCSNQRHTQHRVCQLESRIRSCCQGRWTVNWTEVSLHLFRQALSHNRNSWSRVTLFQWLKSYDNNMHKVNDRCEEKPAWSRPYEKAWGDEKQETPTIEFRRS